MDSKATSPLCAREELKLVKEHLSKCPSVPPTSNAIRVAIAALDQELKRINRDEKLRLKFSSNSGNTVQTNGNDKVLMSVLSDDSMVHVDVDVDVVDADHMRTQENSNTSAGNTNAYTNAGNKNNDEDDDAALNEWQDVEAEGSSNMQVDSSESSASSTMGVLLLQIALQDMSNASTVVSTPTAALALILHAALMSKVVGFKCTGIPDDPCCFKNDGVHEHNNKKQKGFAAPIRELPRGVFLPKMWDAHASLYSHSDITSNRTHRVLLRYSKIGMPVTILKVEIVQDDADADVSGSQVHSHANVVIKFGPLDGEPFETSFPIDQHVNLEGLHKATLREGRGVQPALHYKALSGLFTDFCNRADLGVVDDGTHGSSTAIGNGPSESDLIAKKYARSSVPIPPKARDLETNIRMPTTTTVPNHYPPMIDNNLLRINRNHGHNGIIPGGDFSDDLLPSGLPLPGFANPITGGNGMTGNLMGPNHPAFHRQFNNEDDDYTDDSAGFMPPGGLGMQPRFDPYYPPGVGGRGMPGRAGRGRGRGRGGRYSAGDPNPDHLRPPNSFGGGGDNMFM